MGDYVVDTNVWVMVDKDISKLSLEEIDCLTTCRDWLKEFVEGSDKLVVDLQYNVFREYRDNLKQGGRAYQWLNELETKPRDRKLIEIHIEYDAYLYAVVPPECEIIDKSDRKWVALALKHKPTPPIVNATDTDWELAKDLLNSIGLVVLELSPAYIQKLLKN